MAVDPGTDTSCMTGLRTGRLVSGARLIAEAAYRRLNTPRGTLRGGEEEANYGLDLTECIGSAQTDADRAAMPGRISMELAKDERIVETHVEVTESTDGQAKSWDVLIECGTTAGPFSLRLGVSEVTTTLLGIKAGG
jgi:hypothetical protein